MKTKPTTWLMIEETVIGVSLFGVKTEIYKIGIIYQNNIGIMWKDSH